MKSQYHTFIITDNDFLIGVGVGFGNGVLGRWLVDVVGYSGYLAVTEWLGGVTGSEDCFGEVFGNGGFGGGCGGGVKLGE